ncbi:DivIVA domain-containing protein [Leucobacter soli]|uniref:Cell wall synthesis protein Wag31 n=1 Tax=Leucobacter soli TaxID=2812850 RepID=A0A916NED0_9MICO|nr:DivIVA domain-containing protein [Leucobacter soli]CAG7596667.1 Cell wall synthesis protein Wag31 [Leucobacter soli]
MALTPEEVLNKTFEVTKFRDGYDMDQVDDLLDQIVVELRQRDEEISRLQTELEQANARVAELESAEGAAESAQPAANVSEQTIVVDAQPAAKPEEPVEPAAEGGSVYDAAAVKSSAMLQLALELHDKYIRDGEEQRDRTVAEAEHTANQLVEEAQQKRADELNRLEGERDGINRRISELREFESEYRSTLSSYIQAQLRELEGSPEPKGRPQGLN